MEEERQYFYHPGPNRFSFFAGVIMPTLSITVEATTHICAGVFFDPIPTIWHLMLVIFVPLAQLQVWFAIRRRDERRLALAGFLNAVVIGISAFYSIVYLPLLPMGVLALLFGVGLLPLAPYLSLVAGLMMRRQLRKVAATNPHRSFSIKKRGLPAGLALTTLVIGIIELPATITMIGFQMASSKSPQTQQAGIRFLREYSSLILPIILMLFYAATYLRFAPLARATAAFTALAVTTSSLRFGKSFHPGLFGLFYLSLPTLPTLQFFGGYPLRVVVAELMAPILRMSGFAVIPEATCLNWAGKLISIDAACSGSWWAITVAEKEH